MHKALNNKVLLFIVAILLVANIALIVYLAGTREKNNRNFGNDRQRSPISVFLKNDIGFNKQQMETYEQLRQQHRKKMRFLIEDIRLTKIRFYSHLSDANVNDSVLNQIASTIGEKQKTLELQTFQNFREIRSLSTAVQLPEYDSLIPGVIGKMWFPAGKGPPHSRKDSQDVHH